MTELASPNLLLNISTELAALVGKAAASVVAVHSHRMRSSGFVWRPGLIVTGLRPWLTRANSPSSGLAATRFPHNSWDAIHPRTSPSCASIALICSRWQLQCLLPPWGHSP